MKVGMNRVCRAIPEEWSLGFDVWRVYFKGRISYDQFLKHLRGGMARGLVERKRCQKSAAWRRVRAR